METKLTIQEELAVANAVSLHIRDLSQTIEKCVSPDCDTTVLCDIREKLKSAFRKLTGVNYSDLYD